MTIVDDAPPAPATLTATDAVVDNDQAAAKSSDPWHRVGLIAGGALVVMVVAGLLFLLFEGPIADAWNRTRQQQLASQFAKPIPHSGAGNAVAVLQIPKFGTNVVVAEGDSPEQLRSAPGHRIGTPMPGQLGNSVISGHRSAWGGPFQNVAALTRGDYIVVRATGADRLPHNVVFTVDSVKRVGANDPSPFASSTDHRLTILTGAGGSYSDARVAVTAVSGPKGRVAAAPEVSTSTPGRSAWTNGAFWGAFGALLLAAGLVLVLRRRYHPGAIAAVTVPLLLLGTLGLLMQVDAALPALR